MRVLQREEGSEGRREGCRWMDGGREVDREGGQERGNRVLQREGREGREGGR